MLKPLKKDLSRNHSKPTNFVLLKVCDQIRVDHLLVCVLGVGRIQEDGVAGSVELSTVDCPQFASVAGVAQVR